MNIFFDWEIDDSLKKPSNPKSLLIYDKIRNFYESRYTVLEDDFEKSHTITGKPPLIRLSLEDKGLKIDTRNISDELFLKMEACVSEDDFNYIMSFIEEELKSIDDAEQN